MAGFRTIVINKRCKLESQLGSLVIRAGTEEKIYLREIETLVVESTAVALTSALIADLTESGTNIIFCNGTHLPTCVFLPVHAHHSTAKNIKEQISWTEDLKAKCRAEIICEKIRQQVNVLANYGYLKESETLMGYANSITAGDPDNFEARSASLYFRRIFDKGFSRNNACSENDMLNYGYTVLMSAFAREISACGYLTELGLWHKGVENAFNLASDLMEPFRPIVDLSVLALTEEDRKKYKRHMLRFLYSKIKINDEMQSFIPAVRIYLHRIFKFMRGECGHVFGIEFCGFENGDE